MNCLQCSSLIQSTDKRRKFCNSSCSATYNNQHHPKRHLTKKCKACPNKVYSGHTYCNSCVGLDRHIRGSRVTPERSIASMIRGDGKDASRYSQIRRYARASTSHRPQICENCGYNLHVECCHIKDIHSFPLTATLGEVNHPENLALLCCNCHWEFDHDLIEKINGLWQNAR